MRRQTRKPGVSFFAFQDIITAVVGIFILITLIMVLELLEKVDAAARTPAGDAATIERLIDQTRADADAIEAELASSRERQSRENRAIAMSAWASEEELQKQLEEQGRRNRQLSEQVTAVRRQLEDAQSRLKAATLQADAEVRDIESQIEAMQSTLADINERTEGLKGEDSPLYNDTLADGRALVIIRLGDHPDSSRQISMREGDRQTDRSFNEIDSLIDAIKRRDARRSHYMVLIAPGGAKDFQGLREYFDSTYQTSLFGRQETDGSIRYGFDVIGSENDIKLVFEVDQ